MKVKRHKIPSQKSVNVALGAMDQLMFTLTHNPEELRKLPKKSILLPKEKILISNSKTEKIKRIGEFVVLPKTYSRKA